jgi:glycosyltransferase involved in cell wall biosynthesis
MKKLILINPNQFGYNNATYYYCKYLKKYYHITYLCWDHNLLKIDIPGVKVVYVNRRGNMIARSLRFLRYAFKELRNDPTIVFIKYFKIVSLALRLLKPTYNYVLDIRTGSVHKNSLNRRLHDARLKFETRLFKNVTVISESLAEKLGLKHKAHILPLGADVLSRKDKLLKELNFLYVGTLHNRNIDITIHGFKKFYNEFKNQIPMSYTIIGSGPNNEENTLRDIVVKLGISKVVKITGRIPQSQLGPYFDSANVGISYVPITDYYDVQPVTKTFEYLLSGMPVIATNTSENRKVINQENGVLVGETPEEFYSGMKLVLEKVKLFDSAKIRNTSMNFTWEHIVINNLFQYLKKIS